MNEPGRHLGFLQDMTWSHVLVVLVVLIGSSLLVLAVRRIVRGAAERAVS